MAPELGGGEKQPALLAIQPARTAGVVNIIVLSVTRSRPALLSITVEVLT